MTTKTTYLLSAEQLDSLSLHHDLADPLRLARAFKKYLSSQTMHLYRRGFPKNTGGSPAKATKATISRSPNSSCAVAYGGSSRDAAFRARVCTLSRELRQ